MPNFRFGVRLFREPDAGNPPVRFDEREEETELRQTGMRRRGESPANRHREATVTAPLLDSTQKGHTASLLSSDRDSVLKHSKLRCWQRASDNNDARLHVQPSNAATSRLELTH